MILKINKPQDKEAVRQYIDRLPDKQFIVSITKKKEIRTIPQNRLYQLWIACICDDIGYEHEELKLIYRMMFLRKKEYVIDGSRVEIPISTTELNTAEFTDYLERIERHASSFHGVILPHPEDLHFAEMYERYSNAI